VRAFNKLARTFAVQVETLKRYRGGSEQDAARRYNGSRWRLDGGAGRFNPAARLRSTIKGATMESLMFVVFVFGVLIWLALKKLHDQKERHEEQRRRDESWRRADEAWCEGYDRRRKAWDEQVAEYRRQNRPDMAARSILG
jgi:hypothetical protein